VRLRSHPAKPDAGYLSQNLIFLGGKMKKFLSAIILCTLSKLAAAGPVVEIYQCELNEGKTLADLSAMMDAFTEYLREAGIADSYTAHAGFQQIPIKTNSINWIGIAPTAEDYGKAIEWFTTTPEGAAFGELYQSVYTCENSFMTFITASSGS
jgi:hypothetical protein